MATLESLQKEYEALGERPDLRSEPGIDPSVLLSFDYEYPGEEAEIAIDTEEFTAVCPWTDLPDFGTLEITYVPDRLCIELKSLKYYLLSFGGVGIVQEHVANRILKDLIVACDPLRMSVTLDYKARGGLHTTVTVRHEKQKN